MPDPTAANKIRIFISYSQRDASYLAERLHRDLSGRGFETWFDSLLRAGTSWSRDIERALDQSDLLLALVSGASNDSDFCRAEQLRCIDTNKPIIPILAQRDIRVPLHFQALQFRNFSDSAQYAEQFEKLLGDISDHLQSQKAASSAFSIGKSLARLGADRTADVELTFSLRLFGQPAAINTIAPYAHLMQAGMLPRGRPGAVFMLLGPTGVGKTASVEALAQALHGDPRKFVKIDCGEYQMEHEVAKLIGAPPGYLGHRETRPVLNQQMLAAVTSDQCKISLVLFDEIEKAAPSMTRLLLGVFDKATLRLGDNSVVNFEDSLIFMTSNLGAREIARELHPDFGFRAAERMPSKADLAGRLSSIALVAVRKKFAPEFVNRIDRIIVYEPLEEEALWAILNDEIAALQFRLRSQRNDADIKLDVPFDVRHYLLQKGMSREFGARELKRVVYREFARPLSELLDSLDSKEVQRGSCLKVRLPPEEGAPLQIALDASTQINRPVLLLVHSNANVSTMVETVLSDSGWKVISEHSSMAAKARTATSSAQAALIEHVLPDGSGAQLALGLKAMQRDMLIVVMAGPTLTREDEAQCITAGIDVMRKPFLASELLIRFRGAVPGFTVSEPSMTLRSTPERPLESV